MSTMLADANSLRWAFYGAGGVTGRLILERAVGRGHRPVLVGRNAAALAPLAAPHGLTVVEAPLTAPAALREAIDGCRLVLNAAGPFAASMPALADAAMATGADYLDLCGDLPVLTELLAADGRARAAGVALVGGAGFGVAATDGLVARLAARLDGLDAVWISVAVAAGHASAGVGESTLAALAGGGREVEEGRLVPRRLARRRWREPGPAGAASGIAFASAPLAELAAALHVAAPARVVAGVPMPAWQARVLALAAPLLPPLLRLSSIRRLMAGAGGHNAAGAVDPAALVSTATVRGERAGRTATAKLFAGEGFAAAADMAVHAVETALSRRPSSGSHTPATAFGAGFLDEVPGLRITIEERA